MNYNYHTHTTRCHHAYGEDREYVESAIKSGIKNLGFSDHVPYPYPDTFVSGVRMTPSEVDNYISSIRALRDEYKNDINIYIGFETEYFKEHWTDLCKLLSPYDIDYMILGQHFLRSEMYGIYNGAVTSDENNLISYVDEVIEAIHTNCFSYIAHPDLINFTGDEKIYNREMLRLCKEAKELHIPLEINFCGFMDRRHYPCDRFFSLVEQTGNDVVFGRDAHTPDAFLDDDTLHGCEAIAEKFHLHMLDNVVLKKPDFKTFL